jgi:hypothetical protein
MEGGSGTAFPAGVSICHLCLEAGGCCRRPFLELPEAALLLRLLLLLLGWGWLLPLLPLALLLLCISWVVGVPTN